MKKLLNLYLDSYRGLSRPAWMLAAIMLINRSGAMVLPFLGVYMTGRLHFGIEEAGMVLTCFGLGAVCGSWLGGWLTDRIGQFTVQLSSLWLSVPVFCILPLLTSPTALATGIFVLSVITETFRPANSVSIVSYAKPENVTRAFSLNRMAINLGFSIGPALGGFLAAFSYDWLFYGNALAALGAGGVFYRYFRDKKPVRAAPGAPDSERSNPQPEVSPWRNIPFLFFCLLCGLFSICFFQLLNTLPLFYREVHHLNEKYIGLLLAFSGLMVFFLEMLLVHFAEEHLTVRQTIAGGTFLCGVSFMLLLVPGGQWVLYAGMTALSVSEILAMPFMATVTMQMASPRKQGMYMGLNALAFSAAHVLSPFLGTRTAAYFGFPVLWTATGVVASVAALGFWWVLRKLQ